MFYLLAQITLQPTLPPALAQASVSTRIVRPATASPDEWARSSGAQRTELMIRETDGQVVLVRLIEHQ
jgi:hypothetical protein